MQSNFRVLERTEGDRVTGFLRRTEFQTVRWCPYVERDKPEFFEVASL